MHVLNSVAQIRAVKPSIVATIEVSDFDIFLLSILSAKKCLVPIIKYALFLQKD